MIPTKLVKKAIKYLAAELFKEYQSTKDKRGKDRKFIS